ncbi:MAG: hypothetical protein WEB89_03830 [Balneolales bacterium]
MNKIILFLIFFLTLLNQVALSQIERPNKAYGLFSANITVIENEKYLYEYNIQNADSSEQVLNSFRLSIADPSYYIDNKDISGPETKKWYIDALSEGYISGSAASRFVDFPPENGLAPGESMEISFPSRGLPIVISYYTQGFVRNITMAEFDSLKEAGYTDNEIFLDWRDESYQGTTVAPKVWPDALIPEEFLDTLITYKEQSCDLGWIENQGICQSLEANLNNVKRQLEQGRTQTAANNLQAFLNEVEAIKDRQLSSEAYALLRFNGEYLLNRLKEQD